MSQCSDIAKPTSFKSAATSVHWQKVRHDEFDALKSQGTWILVRPREHRSIIGSK